MPPTETVKPSVPPSNEPAGPPIPTSVEPPPGRHFHIHRSILLTIGGILAIGVVGFLFFYIKYALMIHEKLGGGIAQFGTMIYAAPRVIEVGDPFNPNEIVAQLHRTGYMDSPGGRIGSYNLTPGSVEITTGSESYYEPQTAVIHFANGRVTKILSRTHKAPSQQYALEPELITNLTDTNREKRRPVRYGDLPPHLIQAVIATEDKRFFQHGGLDIFRLAKAAYVDVREGRREQGASTLTMQLARSFFLDQEKTFKRKIAEILITAELERKFSKEQILEFYANEVYLGRRGSFSIHGFGQAARSYFGKEVQRLTLPEAAMLVGVIQRPGYYNAFRHPERVRVRRDLVLTLMHNNNFITDAQYTSALATPIKLSPGETESTDAPYYVDLINDELQSRLQDKDFAANNFHVYTTLDLNLQRDAVAAVRQGMQEVDALIKKRTKGKHDVLPQVALIALDPHTGAVKALVGGRSYGQSQLNHAVAKRQPGSSFKPFVYAAALSTALGGNREIITAATHLLDAPTTFWFNNRPYEPGNFHDEFHGGVTVRQALAKSMNVPAVKVAEKVGYQAVANLARNAGIESNLQPTPSLALGAYETTPLEIADAYTVFSNNGVYVKRNSIQSIRDRRNNIVYANKPESRQVLDPRVAFLMVNLMEEVLRSGTGAAVRSRGFTVPAAGKTGTSRDGWFAGFTSEMLCVVWVGYDDNRELDLEGAKSALPIWTEFMKRAHQYREYRNAQPFAMPEGIVKTGICQESGQVATPSCPFVTTEMFIAGTQPRTECTLHDDFVDPENPSDGQHRGVFGKIWDIFK
jgi:penicillin-binding protein 1B